MIDKHEQKYFFLILWDTFLASQIDPHSTNTLKYMQMKTTTLPDIQVNPELPKSVQRIQ